MRILLDMFPVHRWPWVTLALTLVLVGIEVAAQTAGLKAQWRLTFGLTPEAYHTYVTSAFLHSGWDHLLRNLPGIVLAGAGVEVYYGKRWYLALVFGSAFIVSLVLAETYDPLSTTDMRGYGFSPVGHCLVVLWVYVGFAMMKEIWPTRPIIRAVIEVAAGIGAFVLAGYIVWLAYSAASPSYGDIAHAGGAMVGSVVLAVTLGIKRLSVASEDTERQGAAPYGRVALGRCSLPQLAPFPR